MIYLKPHRKLAINWIPEQAKGNWQTIEFMRGIAENMRLLDRARNIEIISEGRQFVLSFERRADLKIRARHR